MSANCADGGRVTRGVLARGAGGPCRSPAPAPATPARTAPGFPDTSGDATGSAALRAGRRRAGGGGGAAVGVDTMSAKIDSACEPLNGLHWHEVYPCTENFLFALDMRRPKRKYNSTV
jgi:hypothetical protein